MYLLLGFGLLIGIICIIVEGLTWVFSFPPLQSIGILFLGIVFVSAVVGLFRR